MSSLSANEELTRSGEELSRKNTDLSALNEELTAMQEEMRQNIDELARTEQELRKSRERYRNLFETMTEGFAVHEIICDSEGKPVDYRFININPAFERLTGLRRCEVIGKLVSEVMPGTESVWIQRYGAVALTGSPDHFDSFSAVLDRHYEVVAYSPAPRQFAVLFNDVTERRVATEALRESEARLRRFYQSGLLGVIYWNIDGRITEANDRFLEMTGYTREDLAAGRINWISITPPEFRHLDENSGKELESSGVNAKPFEKEYIRKDGSRIPVLVAGAMLDEARVDGVAYVMDITPRKRTEDELKRKHADLNTAYEEITAVHEELQQNVEELTKREAQLQDALAEKEALLSEIHHRVKNNLAAFISLLSLDGSYENTDAGRALRKDLQNRARSMALIHETLYRTGKFSTVDMETYLSTLMSQISDSYAGYAEIRTLVNAKGVVLDLSRATTAGLIVNELVTNSFKYAFPPGFDCMAACGEPCTIRVSFTAENGIHVLSVADNGRGLPAGFDPLTAKSLGLKLVNFLGRHQLRADISVREGRGTEFVFRLQNRETGQER